MKLEEVLPHLRAGGKVLFAGYRWSTLEDIMKYDISRRGLESNDWEIVKEPYKKEPYKKEPYKKEPYKKEHIIERLRNDGYAIDGNAYDSFVYLLPETKKYKVTIEEIGE